jgi:hypothetical protein
MKIILRNSLTGLYYCGDQNWCAEVSEAMNFDSIQAAASVAQELKLETINVVLRYDHPTCELVLPLERCILVVAGAGAKGQQAHRPDQTAG